MATAPARPARARRVAALLLAAALTAGPALADSREVDEYRLKAEFLERFTRFVEWPRGALPADPQAPFRLCVLGRNPFGTALDELARKRTVGERRIAVTQLAAVDAVAGCHLLFVAPSERERLPAVVAAARRERALTVGDSAGFADAGVIINLFVAEQKIGFEINEGAAKAGGFAVSAKLLKLARRVGDG
jgi:hypothetical protein